MDLTRFCAVLCWLGDSSSGLSGESDLLFASTVGDLLRLCLGNFDDEGRVDGFGDLPLSWSGVTSQKCQHALKLGEWLQRFHTHQVLKVHPSLDLTLVEGTTREVLMVHARWLVLLPVSFYDG